MIRRTNIRTDEDFNRYLKEDAEKRGGCSALRDRELERGRPAWNGRDIAMQRELRRDRRRLTRG